MNQFVQGPCNSYLFFAFFWELYPTEPLNFSFLAFLIIFDILVHKNITRIGANQILKENNPSLIGTEKKNQSENT